MVKYLLSDLFGSLSDATRRDMLQRLLLDELTVSQLAKTYNMSLPAVSKHVHILEASGLVAKEKRGRQYFVRLTSAALKEATEHLQNYEVVLHNRLDSFAMFLQGKPGTMPPDVAITPLAKQTIVITNVLNVTPEVAWQAYTDPESIKQWWDVPGTQLATVENDVQVGGKCRFILRGADGRDYVVGGIYDAVDYPHYLSYTDGVGEPGAIHPEALITITFEQLPDGKTLLTKKSTATPAVHQLHAVWLQAAGGG